MLKQTYLGDGLYASFDGFQVILKAPHEDGVHWVALEPLVWNNLIAFVTACARLSEAKIPLDNTPEL